MDHSHEKGLPMWHYFVDFKQKYIHNINNRTINVSLDYSYYCNFRIPGLNDGKMTRDGMVPKVTNIWMYYYKVTKYIIKKTIHYKKGSINTILGTHY